MRAFRIEKKASIVFWIDKKTASKILLSPTLQWSRCSHSELPRVLEGLKAVSRYVSHPVDELILENNNLPSLPGHVFASLRVLRLMLRNNRLERVSSGWLEGLHDSLLELFLVEPDLRSLPIDSLENLQGLEAVTLQSKLIKRLPSFSGESSI